MMFEIVRSLHEKDKQEDYVAIAAQISPDGEAKHSGFVISYKSELMFYHYNGAGIYFENLISDNCFHKITDVIDERLIPSFIVMCKRVLKTANPDYGFFYSGEFYDQNGVHFSEIGMNQVMTCTGFCLNILKGFVEEEYLKYEEWETPDYPFPGYVESYALTCGLEISDIIEFHRRISPMDMICSASFNNLPISKSQIDSKSDEVQNYFNNYFETSN